MNTRCYFLGHSEGKSDARTWDFKCPRCGEYFDRNNFYSKYRDTFWTSDTWDGIKFTIKFIGILLVILIVAALILSVIVIPAFWFSHNSCNSYLEMGIETQWRFWTGCMANHPEFGWLPISDYFRTINIYNP